MAYQTGFIAEATAIVTTVHGQQVAKGAVSTEKLAAIPVLHQ